MSIDYIGMPATEMDWNNGNKWNAQVFLLICG